MTGPDRKAAAELIRFVADLRPSGPTMPDLFMALVQQLDLGPEEIPEFGDECGLEVGVFRLPLPRQPEQEEAV